MVVERMLIREATQHLAVVDAAARIQRHAELFLCSQALQTIEVRGHRRRRIRIVEQAEGSRRRGRLHAPEARTSSV